MGKVNIKVNSELIEGMIMTLENAGYSICYDSKEDEYVVDSYNKSE